MNLNASINTTRSTQSLRAAAEGASPPGKRASNSVVSPSYSFTQEKLIDPGLEQSIMEFLQGAFENVSVPAFKRMFDGDVQLQVLNQMEKDFWNKEPVKSNDTKRASGVF